jgi:hypothetical protein
MSTYNLGSILEPPHMPPWPPSRTASAVNSWGPTSKRKLGLIAKLHYQFVKINHVAAAVFDAAHIRQIRQFAKQIQAKACRVFVGALQRKTGKGICNTNRCRYPASSRWLVEK